MASVFSTTEGPCGVFAPGWPCGGAGGTQTLSFARAAHLLHGQAPTQNARGDLRLSFVGIGNYTGSLQPLDRAVLREIFGIVAEQAWMFVVTGTTGLHELDRAVVEGYQVEIVQVGRYYGSHDEILLQQLGR